MMKLTFTALLLLAWFLSMPPAVLAKDFVQKGEASWYGAAFHGQTTASGETYNMYQISATHKYLPLGAKVRVTNLRNNKSIVVRINDRGPYVKGRIIDLSKAAARELGMMSSGTAPVRIETVDAPAGVTREGDVQGIFFVQVATFSEHEAAMNLFRRLQQDHDEPRLLQITDPDGVTAHVQLGPFTALSEANTALKSHEDEFPEAYVMAELEGASLRSYLRANGHKKAAAKLAALQRKTDEQETQPAPEVQKERILQPPELPDKTLQGLAPCGFPLQAGKAKGAFFVQLVMYNLHSNAATSLQNLKPATSPVRIVRTDLGSRVTYMIQAGPFATRPEAQTALKNYKQRFRDAFILPGSRLETDNSCVMQALAGGMNTTPSANTMDNDAESIEDNGGSDNKNAKGDNDGSTDGSTPKSDNEPSG